MADSEPVILVEADEDIRIVTLNRPHVLNCVNPDMHERLTTVWAEIAADPGAGAVVLEAALIAEREMMGTAEFDRITGNFVKASAARSARRAQR